MPEQTGTSHYHLPPIVRVATPVQVKPEKPELPHIAAIPRAMTKQKTVMEMLQGFKSHAFHG